MYNYTTHTANLYPYNQVYTPAKNIPIVAGESAYADSNGTSFILIINKALFYGSEIDHSLLNPNQLRFNNLHSWNNPYDKNNPLSIRAHDVLTIPL